VSEGRITPCCQTSDEEIVRTDPSVFNCETCAVRSAIEALDSVNAEAWGHFRRLCTRFLFETKSTPVALARITESLDAEDCAELLQRFAILYDAYYPVKVANRGA